MLACAKNFRVVSPSRERALANRSSLWSYGSSRDRNRLPDGQNVFSGVVVPVMFRGTFGTLPLPHIQRQFIYDVPATTAPLRGWEEPIDLNDGSSVPVGFVAQLPGYLMPTAIANCFGETTVSHHVARRQVFKVDRLVLANDPGSCFVREIFSGIINLGMQFCDLDLGLGPILRSPLLLRKSPLKGCQLLFVLCRVARVPDTGSIRERQSPIDPEINPHTRCCFRKLVDWFIQPQRNEVAARTVSTQSHGRRVGCKRSAPLYLESAKLCDSQVALYGVPLETGSSILSGLLSVLCFERWVFRYLLKGSHGLRSS